MAKFAEAARAAEKGRRARAALVAAILSLSLILAGCAAHAENGVSSGQQDVSQQTDASGAQQAALAVTVSVSADVEGFEALDVAVSLPAGGSAYDALAASGVDVVASDSEYGMFVESVAGLAGDSSHAWVFTVNGEQVMEACDARMLADGDSVEWSYISW